MKKDILNHILPIITLCLSSAGIFFGCKSDDDVAPKSRVAANFFGNVISATRLDGTAWEVGDEIGLFQWQQDGHLADALTSNTRYAVNTDGTCSVGDGDSAIFLLRDSLYTITGYYPFTVNEIEDDSIYQISDWNRQNELNYDLLFAQATGVSADAPDVTLTFAHRFCQLLLNIVVDASSSITADSLAELTVTLSGKNIPVSLNLHSGALTYNYATVGGNIVVPVEIDEDTPTQATASAIVAPDEANTVSDRVLTFTFASGRVHTYTIPANLMFEAGKAYEMNFTFTGDHIIYVSADGVEGADGRALETALPTVTAAVERIVQFRNPVDWTICVSGEVVAANEISSALTSEHATSLTITGLHENSGDNYTDILDGGSTYAETAGEATINGSVISISTEVPITISNLKITNGISTGGYGGGIQMGAAVGELTLESGAWITENHTYYSAGGIMISGGDAQYATVIMKEGSRVTNNTSGSGGGIWNTGKLIMEGGEISGNQAGSGAAVEHAGVLFSISGSAYIPAGDDADNPQDVYLAAYSPFTAYSITVAGELTGTSPVMTIQGSSGYISAYEGYQIIKAGDGVTLTSDIIGKFALTETDSYFISANGYLCAYSGTTDGYGWVDLGLSSGTLWATCNVGASSPEEAGNFYAWGETKARGEEDMTNETNYASAGSYIKNSNYWDTYKYCNGSNAFYNQSLTKYNYSETYGVVVDNVNVLKEEDDAAYVNWGENWRMPSYVQIQELANNCTITETTLNGVSGYNFVGPSGQSIFFPVVGYYNDDPSSSGSSTTSSYYWSRDLDEQSPYAAQCMNMVTSFNVLYGMASRCQGCSIRPVRNK